MLERGLQGIFLDDKHRLTVAFGEVAATIAMAPDEMRAFAAHLLASANALELGAAEAADAVLLRAAGRPH